MESTNAFEITPGPSVVGCVPNINIDEDSTNVPANEVSGAITPNISKSRDEKTKKKPNTEEEKLSQKRKMTTEDRQPLKRKKNNSLPISQMVMESIKALKKRNGATVKAILEHMEGQYKEARRHVTKYLLSAVEKGILDELSRAGNDGGRYKIKKVEKITKVEQKSKGNQTMVKVAKAGQKPNNNQKMLKAGKVAKVEKKPNQRKVKGEKVAEVK